MNTKNTPKKILEKCAAPKKKKRGNPENLRVLSSNEAREQGRKGGIKSGQSRREAADLRKRMNIMLTAETMYDGEKMTYADALCLAMLKAAINGVVPAAAYVRDTSGQKPAEQVEQTISAKVSTNDLSKIDTATLLKMVKAAKADIETGA